ncbi:MAG: hypothetical protein SynsKO_13020 [Synoicihabitans sp.]
MVSRLLAKFIRPFLGRTSLGRYVAFDIVQDHYGLLNIEIPLTHGLSCPLTNREHLLSFGEIFLQGEYTSLFEHIPLPQRWLDVGAHAGFFSLELIRRHYQKGNSADFNALLIEPDPRGQRGIETTIRKNNLGASITGIQAAVGSEDKEISFAVRSGMASSLDFGNSDKSGSKIITVPTISEAEILLKLPPPYDLLKIDVEGAEFSFVKRATRILARTKALLVEWHAPSGQSPEVQEMYQNLAAAGLQFRARIQAERPAGYGQCVAVDLFQRKK